MNQWFEAHWLKPAAVPPSEAVFRMLAAPWIEMTRGDFLPRQNGRDGKPLKLGDTTYTRGLACAPRTTPWWCTCRAGSELHGGGRDRLAGEHGGE